MAVNGIVLESGWEYDIENQTVVFDASSILQILTQLQLRIIIDFYNNYLIYNLLYEKEDCGCASHIYFSINHLT